MRSLLLGFKAEIDPYIPVVLHLKELNTIWYQKFKGASSSYLAQTPSKNIFFYLQYKDDNPRWLILKNVYLTFLWAALQTYKIDAFSVNRKACLVRLGDTHTSKCRPHRETAFEKGKLVVHSPWTTFVKFYFMIISLLVSGCTGWPLWAFWPLGLLFSQMWWQFIIRPIEDVFCNKHGLKKKTELFTGTFPWVPNLVSHCLEMYVYVKTNDKIVSLRTDRSLTFREH